MSTSNNAPETAGRGTSASRHDVDLSKLLSKLLRHKAVELGTPIAADGWVALSDALAQVNGQRLRSIVGNADSLSSRAYTADDVIAVIAADDKQRFECSTDGTRLRAAQGHTMAGVAEAVGEPLTPDTAPAVAVHGSYIDHLDSILSGGLKRMARHHVHLAKGLLGEAGVISGMRRNAELFIWVNVREALEDGLRFFESANGVILGDGRDGDGVIPSKYFSVVIELRGGLCLHAAQVRLLQRAFAGCLRVAVTKLHGGFSGSLVLKTDAYGADGSRDEPSVTKLDSAAMMMEEVERTRAVAALIGDGVTQVVRGPLVCDASGREKQIASAPCSTATAADEAATDDDFACVVLDLAGACW